MIFEYKGKTYPEIVRQGNGVKHIANTARCICNGKGLDIGGTDDWCLPGAYPINIEFNDDYDAYTLPNEEYDYIFSSHTLEHLYDPIKALELWKGHIVEGGVLFLYLPHPDMEYWLPQNNRKHLHTWQPREMQKILQDLGFKDVIHSERDLNYSFSVVGKV
jgi:SAM-dependent methyltransferase